MGFSLRKRKISPMDSLCRRSYLSALIGDGIPLLSILTLTGLGLSPFDSECLASSPELPLKVTRTPFRVGKVAMAYSSPRAVPTIRALWIQGWSSGTVLRLPATFSKATASVLSPRAATMTPKVS